MPHHFTVHLPIPPATVEDLLGSYPATWLRRFLRLASNAVAERSGALDVRNWYKLGQPTPDGPGRTTVSLTWWPHAGDVLFECFRGAFVVVAIDAESRLELAGDSVGGDDETNATVLRSVVELIGAALRAAHPPADSR